MVLERIRKYLCLVGVQRINITVCFNRRDNYFLFMKLFNHLPGSFWTRLSFLDVAVKFIIAEFTNFFANALFEAVKFVLRSGTATSRLKKSADFISGLYLFSNMFWEFHTVFVNC